MPSVFTQIIRGELPGRVVWQDEKCFALLTHRPIKPGHLLVVPREEVDHWIDLPADLSAHLFGVAQHLGRALQEGFHPVKVGLLVAGLEVRHVHLHLVPANAIADLDFAKQELNADPEALDQAAQTVRDSLRKLGFSKQVVG